MRVRPLREHVDVTYDLMIVASLVPSELLITRLVAEGVPHDKLLPLRQDGPSRRKTSQEMPTVVNG